MATRDLLGVLFDWQLPLGVSLAYGVGISILGCGSILLFHYQRPVWQFPYQYSAGCIIGLCFHSLIHNVTTTTSTYRMTRNLYEQRTIPPSSIRSLDSWIEIYTSNIHIYQEIPVRLDFRTPVILAMYQRIGQTITL